MRATSSSRHPRLATLGAVLLAIACGALSASPIYQWKDAKGVTHYSDKPPAGQQYQDRRIDPRGEPVPEAVPVGKSVENPQCTTARKNLEILSGSAPVHQADADGKPGKVLSDADRANQRALAEAAQKAYCTPAN